jgi:hypothetical protein
MTDNAAGDEKAAVLVERRDKAMIVTINRPAHSRDAQEGPKAFAEKRTPVWEAR